MSVKMDRLNKFLDVAYSTVYHEPNTPNFHDKLIKQIYDELLVPKNIDKNAAIVDIGCGSGYFLSLLKQEGFTNAQGITYDDQDIDECKKLGVNASKSDFTFSDFNDDQFDFIWCRQTLEHSVWPFFTLLEFNRILKKGGEVYIDVPGLECTKNHESNPNHFAVMGKQMWIELFKRAGFEISWQNNFEFGCTEDIGNGITVNHKEIYYMFIITKIEDLVKD